MTELTERFEPHDRAIQYCTFCPKLCRHACPVAHAEARETVTPQAKNALVGLVRSGQAPLDAEAVDIFHRCTGCGLHATACELEVEVAPVLFEARAAGVDAGVVHPALVGLVDEIAGPRESAAPGATVWFSGCASSEGLATAGLRAARRIEPAAAAVDVGCCGYPLLAGGHPEAFARHARAVSQALEPAALVLTGDPICAWTMRMAWPERAGVPAPTIRHLAEVASSPRPRRDLGATAYHDPCHLSRRLGVTDEPRALVAAATGEAPKELPWAAKGGWCSGGGGLLPRTAPETAHGIASELLDQVRGTGASTVVTACPRCHERLSLAAEDLGADGGAVHVVDLIELL